MLFVNNNGTILASENPHLHASSRAFLYGDGVFETIRIINGKPINLENHIKRLLKGAELIKLKTSSAFTPEYFYAKIVELCKMSHITEGGRCRLSFDRFEGGTYMPETNELSYFIDVAPYSSNKFALNQKGLEVDVYTDIKKNKSFLSNYKTKNGLLYVMTAIRAKELNLDDLLITNEKDDIIESSNSNLFVVSNGILYTPSLEDGCLAGTMRMQLINIALHNGIKVYESTILPQNLLMADEIFLTNAVSGIKWVSGYRTKRYFNSMSKKLILLLNDYWENRMLEEDSE